MTWSERTISLKIAIVMLWIVTVLVAALMALAGQAKFTRPDVWTGMFLDWGYPAWFSFVIGGAEFGGALLLIFPRFATYAATGLAIIMAGALVTVIVNSSSLGVGAPIANIVLLSMIGAVRWRSRWTRTPSATAHG